MILRFLRFWCWLALKFGVYYWWSRIYRKLVGWKYKNVVLPIFSNLYEIKRAVSQMEWRADGLLELGDAISNAKIAWGRHKSKKGSNDCDDISVFVADRIHDMLGHQTAPIYPGIQSLMCASLLTCSWRSGCLKTGGHNVCVFGYRLTDGSVRFGWISNWYDGTPVIDRKNVLEIVHDILSEAGDVEPLGAALVAHDNLSLIHWLPGSEI